MSLCLALYPLARPSMAQFSPSPGAHIRSDAHSQSAGTKDHTIVRKSTVQSGNYGDWTTSAGTTADDCGWIVYDKNDWSYLGSHTMATRQHPCSTVSVWIS